MPVWVTLRNGEVRKYNRGGSFNTEGDFTYIRERATDTERHWCLCKIRTSDIAMIEFEEPCSVNFVGNLVEKSIDILLRNATKITDYSVQGKLADLARLLRGFNPQRREWKQ